MEKPQAQYVEDSNDLTNPEGQDCLNKGDNDLEAHSKPQDGYNENTDISQLSEEYRQYLLNRHGTLELDPVPEMNDADPFNWPKWKVRSPQVHQTRAQF
jgi:hypothetical protein